MAIQVLDYENGSGEGTEFSGWHHTHRGLNAGEHERVTCPPHTHYHMYPFPSIHTHHRLSSLEEVFATGGAMQELQEYRIHTHMHTRTNTQIHTMYQSPTKSRPYTHTHLNGGPNMDMGRFVRDGRADTASPGRVDPVQVSYGASA